MHGSEKDFITLFLHQVSLYKPEAKTLLRYGKQLNLFGILARALVSLVDWLCLCRFVDESDPSTFSVRPICPAGNELREGCVPVTRKINCI